MLIESQDIIKLRERDLRIDDRAFLLAVDVVQRKPLTVRIATSRAGLPLYAVPGGERKTERDIRALIKQGAL